MTGEACSIPKNSDVFTLGELIGTGSFANVYKAVEKRTKNTIAIKSYRMNRRDLGHFSRAATEMAFIRFLNHPNIIGYILADIRKRYMYLGIEYSRYGSLLNLIERQTGFTGMTIQCVMRQLLSALIYLHSISVFHGDVKPENIIVMDIRENNITIKLSDFGLADIILTSHVSHRKSGSFYYMAPEIHLGFPSDHTSDLFSAGIVMYEMLFSQKPFNVHIPKDQYISLLRRRVQIVFPNLEYNLVSPNCLNLVQNLLSYDKRARLSGASLAEHPYLNITIIKDEQDHYMKACECLIIGVEYVNNREYGAGYIQIIEAILHLKIYISRIQNNDGLYRYMMTSFRKYLKYSEKIEEKLLLDRFSEHFFMQTHNERLKCLLKPTPPLLCGYDMCSVGEMYYRQGEIFRGSNLIKQGLDLIFPIFQNEPAGLRRQLLAAKLDHWVTLMENLIERVTINC